VTFPFDPFEMVVTVTFVEGLVEFGDSWPAYHGQSETTIGVGVCPSRLQG
jgi:hypothetical protein